MLCAAADIDIQPLALTHTVTKVYSVCVCVWVITNPVLFSDLWAVL